ncbi:hypothetical protein GWO70_002330 [Corynebacterium macginleyi]|uniref:hypothetical protein n=1 Tax=Corynebacterium macginleyi TaxID=38290 RepID=UPI00190C6C1F|nr:hypothetical protein [Corynebacterium macginleyi]QRJ60423.1 hypothetical protein GWO70_002330 [Corynebacterium macginleyi]
MRLELLVRLRVRGSDHRAKRKTKASDSTVLWALNSVTQAILEKLFATTPPMVQAKLAVARPQTRIDLVRDCPWLYAPLLASANPRMFRSSPLATGSG